MSVVKELFEEYINMRENGMSSKDALNALHQPISPISKSDKQLLAQALRKWEKQAKVSQEAEYADTTEQEEEGLMDRLEKQQMSWVECPTCGKKNRANAVFCYSCGLMMDISAHMGTRHFSDSSGKPPDYFGVESVLTLRAPETNHEYELHPQQNPNELLIGRTSANNVMPPDVDLNEAGGDHQGVSRLHLSIKYDKAEDTLEINDLSSANGTSINGHKLHPKEVRILRDGDELQLGKLVLFVSFYHPGSEVR
jgi:hypothetical protein